MGNGWTIEREIIPKIEGNEEAPEDEQVRVYFKPLAVREKGPWVKGLMKLARETVEDASELQERCKTAEESGEVPDELLGELLGSADEQKARILEYVFGRVTRGKRGNEAVSGRSEVWDKVSGDDALVNAICGEILDAAGLGRDGRPF
tara:strand:- start:504 stop:947 length:444 start_codon:yes stop_codon:yes gene_type:complete